MDHEVIVIGGGPGGYVAAIKAAQAGKKTCVVEAEHLGGVCLNEGCIPTKTLIRTVDLFSQCKRAEEFAVEGVDPAALKVSMKKLQARKKQVVTQLVSGVRGLLKGNGVTVETGRARFLDPHTLDVNGKQITGDNIIIATGSETSMAGFIQREGDTNIITSREALSLEEVPASMAIIGGGVIGVELAFVYASLGCSVTILELMDRILPMVDEEVSSIARKRLSKQGITILTSAKVKAIRGRQVAYELDGREQTVDCACVLLSVGRAPNTAELDLEKAGVALNGKAIETDAHMRTNVPGIYAIGDVNGKSMLAHTASHEGCVAVKNICGEPAEMHYNAIPSCIYLEPEIASVGLTEAQAREQRGAVRVGKFPLRANGKALIEGETDGMIKVILDEELGEILGVHIYGPRATDMIAELSLAMSMEATADEVLEAVHPHPTFSEIVPEAFMAAVGKAVHNL